MKGVKLDHVACAVKKIENCFGLLKKLSGIPLKGKKIRRVIVSDFPRWIWFELSFLFEIALKNYF
jgi:hypothetical protein